VFDRVGRSIQIDTVAAATRPANRRVLRLAMPPASAEISAGLAESSAATAGSAAISAKPAHNMPRSVVEPFITIGSTFPVSAALAARITNIPQR
jgi:hypothetical protein